MTQALKSRDQDRPPTLPPLPRPDPQNPGLLAPLNPRVEHRKASLLICLKILAHLLLQVNQVER